jgi:cyanate lyase
VLTKEKASETILAAKKTKGVGFADLAKAADCHPVFMAAAVMGQASLTPDQAEGVTSLLGLGPEVAESLQEFPMKGSLDATVPVDPLIYRFYEIMQVYGTSMKAVIHELFGDGIMSAIDFEIDIQRKPDPKGDRVVVVFDGKFLPYKKW